MSGSRPDQEFPVSPAETPSGEARLQSSALPSGWRVLHPNLYTWFVFFAVLDIICTYLILHPATFPPELVMQSVGGPAQTLEIHRSVMQGAELNPMADWIINRFDVPGKVAFKFLLVLGVILICEFVSRKRPPLGKRLAEWAVALTIVPVAVAMAQLINAALIYVR